MTRIPSLMMTTFAVVLAVLGARAVIAQQPDKHAVQVPNGLSLSAFRGYEGWEVVSVARTDAWNDDPPRHNPYYVLHCELLSRVAERD